ncbi:COP9 signalosome (CSN) subunit [Coemansia erecta]|nr:COP9 signalosome (CSN) subunit [Coemansia erecta]
MTDREPSIAVSRKWGTFRMANILFALYLRQRAYNLCTSMVRAIRSTELPPLDKFPMSDQVTFRFYRGVLAFRSENYAAAKMDLMFALGHCHREAQGNKRRIMTYLVPLMMMDGFMPQKDTLKKYPEVNMLYGGLIDAAKTGNVGLFDRLLAEKQDRLAALGTFLAVEHARKIAVRQLLHKVYLIDGRNSRIPFDRFKRAMEFACGCNIESIEVEAVLADMIFCGYLKGYLAHSHGLAVLSKQMPFPPLSTLVTQTPPPPNGA